ncbi:MAG: hypothetical protein AAGM67_07700 [Bacteroidota bacterium]
MEINTLIFGFSIFVMITGIIMFILMSRQFKKMSNKKFQGGKEGGPRAYLFHKLDEFFSEADDMPTELMHARKSEIKKIVDEME